MTTSTFARTALAWLLLGSIASADPMFTAIAVPPSGYGSVVLNDNGQYTTEAYGRTFLVDGYGPNAGQAVPINIPGATLITPTSINDSGQVVGVFTTANGGQHAFLYSNGQVTDLTTQAGIIAPSNEGWGVVINNQGEISGASLPPGSPVDHLVVYNHGATTDLGAPPGVGTGPSGWPTVAVSGINDTGQMIVNAEPNISSYIYINGNYGRLTSSYYINGVGGAAINHSGQVAGAVYGTQGSQAALFTNGAVQLLGNLGGTSYATAINDRGEIVGASMTGDVTKGGTYHAFLYENGKMYDLNNLLPPSISGATLWEAKSINNLGQIVAVEFRGQYYGSNTFILTPSDLPALASPKNLPEPTTMALFGLFVAGVALRRAVAYLRAASASGTRVPRSLETPAP